MNIQTDNPNIKYQILDPLGDGSYGYVYKGINNINGKTVAIKKIPIIETEIDTCMKEIEIIGKCESEYIVSYETTYLYDNYLWIIMEYCEAGSISDLIKAIKEPMKESEISLLLYSTLKGLDYLHQNKLIHRDIKAANILLDNKGRIKIADFGVSAQITSTIGFKESFIGTPYWMSPEIINYNNHTNKTDIWSLGITTIEIITGEPPYAKKHPNLAMKLLSIKPPTGLPTGYDFSNEFNDFVSKCLIYDPNKRPSASELLIHPFILKYKNENALVKLINKHWNQIEKFRLNKSNKIKNGRRYEYSCDDQIDKEENVNNNSNEKHLKINASGTIIERVEDNGYGSIVYHEGQDNGNFQRYWDNIKKINLENDIQQNQNEFTELYKKLQKLNYAKVNTVEDDYKIQKDKMEKKLNEIRNKYYPELEKMEKVIQYKTKINKIKEFLLSIGAEVPVYKNVKKKKKTKQIVLNNQKINKKNLNIFDSSNVSPKIRLNNKKSPIQKKKNY